MNKVILSNVLVMVVFLFSFPVQPAKSQSDGNKVKPVPQVYLKPPVAIYSQYIDPNLANMIKQGKKEIYRIYLIPNTINYQNVEKQYWEGLVVMPRLKAPDHIHKFTDTLGNTTTQFYYDKQTDHLYRISSNSRGVAYEVETINPNGITSTLVDLSQNNVADYIETTFPDGRTVIAVNELRGLGFLDGKLSGNNSWCEYSSIFNRSKRALPGCYKSTSSSHGESSYGVATDAGASPLDSFMNNVCSGVRRTKPGRWTGRNYSQSPTVSVSPIGRQITSVRETNNGQTREVHETIKFYNERNEQVTTNFIRTVYIGGVLRERHQQTYNHNNGTITTMHAVYDKDGNAIEISDDIIPGGADKTDPGPEPLPDDQTGLSIVCNNWFNSKGKKPGSIAELDSKSKADCNPFATTSNPDSTATDSIPSKEQYLDNCYAGLEGSRNILDLVGISEASNSNCGAYEDPGPDGKCRGNRIKQIKNGALINGAGIQAVEVCNPLLCRGPD